jgi:hypothetical protein
VRPEGQDTELGAWQEGEVPVEGVTTRLPQRTRASSRMEARAAPRYPRKDPPSP